MPKGIKYIIGNEAAERFSFYGMKGILVVFMTKYLHLLTDNPDLPAVSRAAAIENYHDFTSWVYLTPILGALLADTLLGKYRTIISLSLVYCLGHLCLAFMGSAGMSPEHWMITGLALIAVGSGGIKPCVSAHVGDQFGASNGNLLTKVFGWFYIAINVGAFLSTLLTPLLLDRLGPHWAFGIPGVLMAIATFVFWMGRHKFVHIPAKGFGFFKEAFSPVGLKALSKLTIIFCFVAVFWALFDQTGSSWVLQAEDLDRDWLGVTWLPSQIQAINPIMIVTLVPLFTYVVYPAINKVFKLTPLRKISIGLFVMVVGFAMVSLLQAWIDQGQRPSIGWQVFAYAILTSSEVMVSITCLEFAYTQSPRAMKSVIMAVFLMSVSLGNFFTAGVNSVIQVENQTAAADELVGMMFETDEEGELVATGSDEIDTLVAEARDVQGNPIVREIDEDGSFTLVLAGHDPDVDTDDIRIEYDAEGKRTAIATAEQAVLEQATAIILEYFNTNGETLPVTEAGQELLGDLQDSYETPIRYRLVNRNSFRVTSLGADREYMTPLDVVRITEISRPSGDEEANNRPYSWRENRIIELRGEEGRAQVERERGGIDSIEFAHTTMIGGQTNLEGAAYFWFFTILMLVTALVFVGVAFLYKPQEFLQEEEGEGEGDADGTQDDDEAAAAPAS